MQTLPIVEDFDVFEHGRLRLLAGAEADLVDVLRLERGEEALHGRVIEAVAAAAHGLRDAVPLQHRPVGLGYVLGCRDPNDGSGPTSGGDAGSPWSGR